jgi:predicted DNA-binding protein YlxM (UPF0122 family)
MKDNKNLERDRNIIRKYYDSDLTLNSISNQHGLSGPSHVEKILEKYNLRPNRNNGSKSKLRSVYNPGNKTINDIDKDDENEIKKYYNDDEVSIFELSEAFECTIDCIVNIIMEDE